MTNKALSAKQTVVVLTVLVVVAAILYIFFLAGAGVWHARKVEQSTTKVLTGLRGQRADLAAAVEAYHKQYGYYPPYHPSPDKPSGVMNPLYYELIGTRQEDKGAFHLPTTKDSLSPAEVDKYFHLRAFSNSLPFPNWPTNFLAAKAVEYVPLVAGEDVYGLAVNDGLIVPEGMEEDFHFTPWRYTTEPAEHNPGKFDLWIELTVAGNHYTIGNWPAVE